MRNSTRFSISGPVRSVRRLPRSRLPRRGERILLALLLLREGQLVPFQQVIAALWDTNPPTTARAQVHSCVSRLRQLLRRVGLPEELVITEPSGYRSRSALTSSTPRVCHQDRRGPGRRRGG